MSASTLRHFTCPLCGRPNECAPARTGTFATPCWCRDVVVAPDALDRVPAMARGLACVCTSCATGRSDKAASSDSDHA